MDIFHPVSNHAQISGNAGQEAAGAAGRCETGRSKAHDALPCGEIKGDSVIYICTGTDIHYSSTASSGKECQRKQRTEMPKEPCYSRNRNIWNNFKGHFIRADWAGRLAKSRAKFFIGSIHLQFTSAKWTDSKGRSVIRWCCGLFAWDGERNGFSLNFTQSVKSMDQKAAFICLFDRNEKSWYNR